MSIKIVIFADFEQVIIKNSHFADFEQVENYLADFEQIKKLTKLFFEATTLCHWHSTLASQTHEGLHQSLYPDTGLFLFHERLGIQFFNSPPTPDTVS